MENQTPGKIWLPVMDATSGSILTVQDLIVYQMETSFAQCVVNYY